MAVRRAPATALPSGSGTMLYPTPLLSALLTFTAELSWPPQQAPPLSSTMHIRWPTCHWSNTPSHSWHYRLLQVFPYLPCPALLPQSPPLPNSSACPKLRLGEKDCVCMCARTCVCTRNQETKEQLYALHT